MNRNEAKERFAAWQEACRSCLHARHYPVTGFCRCNGQPVLVHPMPVLYQSDVANASSWLAANGDHTWSHWFDAAAAVPRCPLYERSTR